MRRQIALCIGNDDYQYSCLNKLSCAVNDATDISKKLEQLNYDVILQANLNSEAMHRAIDEFKALLPKYDVALFYFAGHGFEIEGENLLMPIDTKEGDSTYKKWVALKLNTVIDALEGKSVENNIQTKIIILDACRQSLGSRGGYQGFAPVFAPVGTIIAFSTSPGQFAFEANGHGRYTNALIQCIDIPRIPIENMFKHVRELVAAQTNGSQISWEHTSLMGNYIFNEDRIDAFSTYSDGALADADYIFAKQNRIGNIVEQLKSHDWNQQNPAINELITIDWKISSANDLFVLGRNICQAANGGAWGAQRFIRDFSGYLYIPLEARIHILNGMAFEIYYNRQGEFRQKFKSEFYLEILGLLEKEDYLACQNFISSRLIDEKDAVIYIPATEERMEFFINFKECNPRTDEDNIYMIDSIYFHGRNVLCFDEEENEYYWTRSCHLSDFKLILAKQIIAPPDMVIIKSNKDEEKNCAVAIPFNFCLKLLQ